MNNEPDYKDNLAFKPEMTWEELCEYAKSKGLDVFNNGFSYISCMGILLMKSNIIIATGTATENRTYEQMYQIMLALQ